MGEVPRSLNIPCLEQDTPKIRAPGFTASPGCILAYFHRPRLYVSPGHQSGTLLQSCWVHHGLGLSLSYLRLGPQSTWPPGRCPEGSWAAEAAARASGSCSSPSVQLGLRFLGLMCEAGRAAASLSISLTSDLFHLHHHVDLVPGHVGQGTNQVRREPDSKAWALLTCSVILGKSLFLPSVFSFVK